MTNDSPTVAPLTENPERSAEPSSTVTTPGDENGAEPAAGPSGMLETPALPATTWTTPRQEIDCAITGQTARISVVFTSQTLPPDPWHAVESEVLQILRDRFNDDLQEYRRGSALTGVDVHGRQIAVDRSHAELCKRAQAVLAVEVGNRLKECDQAMTELASKLGTFAVGPEVSEALTTYVQRHRERNCLTSLFGAAPRLLERLLASPAAA